MTVEQVRQSQWRAQHCRILGIKDIKDYPRTRKIIFVKKEAHTEVDNSNIDTLSISPLLEKSKGGESED